VLRRGPEALALFRAQMDVLDGKGDVEAIAKRMLDLPDGQQDASAISPMAALDAAYWYIAAGRGDLAVERLARYKDVLPSNLRLAGFDPHLAVLHCDPKFVEVLRSVAHRPELTASRLAGELPITRQAVAKHLAALQRAGLVEPRREGRETHYTLTPAPLVDAMGWMAEVGAAATGLTAGPSAGAGMGFRPRSAVARCHRRSR